MKPEQLSTKRLILRRATERDTDMLFHNYTSDPECSRFLARRPHTSIEQTLSFLQKWCDTPWDQGSNQFAWVISLAHTDEAIGIFLVEVDGDKAQIHYGISRQFWRRGFVTEAGQAVIQWLNDHNIYDIWTVSDLLNEGSIGVLSKLGFQKERIMRNGITLPAFGETARDCYIYTRTQASNNSSLSKAP